MPHGETFLNVSLCLMLFYLQISSFLRIFTIVFPFYAMPLINQYVLGPVGLFESTFVQWLPTSGVT
jgi:hypothetical protein